jgi:2-polyprenyl-6-methoxyphenol hydroxylase-like FAD-dependent oxidoreductase
MSMNIAIVGGGIAGLSFALGLHQRGIDCDVFESVPEVKESGVGITLLPHGMRELAALGVQEHWRRQALKIWRAFSTQHGQYVYKEASWSPCRLHPARNWHSPRQAAQNFV